jgi:hypothetical protein
MAEFGWSRTLGERVNEIISSSKGSNPFLSAKKEIKMIKTIKFYFFYVVFELIMLPSRIFDLLFPYKIFRFRMYLHHYISSFIFNIAKLLTIIHWIAFLIHDNEKRYEQEIERMEERAGVRLR